MTGYEIVTAVPLRALRLAGTRGMRKRARAALIVGVTLLAAAPVPAHAYSRPGRTEIASRPIAAVLDGQTSEPSISGDGRSVAFSSWATNLLPDDTNGRQDIFVRDRASGALEIVSRASDGTQTDAESYDAHMSADGRFVVFESDARNLVGGDANGVRDIFVRDRFAGTTERVSVATGGTQSNAASNRAAISADGRFVAFDSPATNLVPGDTNGLTDVFVRDLVAGTTERISVGSDGTQGDGSAFWADISADGRRVAFQSGSLNIAPGPPVSPLSSGQIFVKDRATGATSLVSTSSERGRANGPALVPHISADGRRVVFTSTATNLSAWDNNGNDDVFVKDLATGRTERVSLGSEGVANDGGAAYGPTISADGRFVAFASGGTNLVPGDTNAAPDIFVRDLESGTTERVSVSSVGAQGPGSSSVPDISGDGRFVSFWTNSVLEDGDSVPYYDVYVRHRGPATGPGAIDASPPSGDTVAVSGWARFPGAVLAAAADPPEDGLTGAGLVGADLAAASVAYRPEEGDLLVRLDLTDLPGQRPPDLPPGFMVVARGGLPAVVYGLELTPAGVRHEVRAIRMTAEASTNPPPVFALYRCDPGCSEVRRLAGGLGTTGEAVQVAVPLEALGVAEGASLGTLRAFTGFGDIGTGSLAELDSAALGPAALPVTTIALGVAPAGTPAADVGFGDPVPVAAGAFSGSVRIGAGDASDVWVRACLGTGCGFASVRVSHP